MNRFFFLLLLVGGALSILGSIFKWNEALLFLFYSLIIVALANYIGKSTESLALIYGPRIGGLLNVTFGNAVELIISIFALRKGLISIVMASLTGSIIGNLLLVTGASFFVGGLKHSQQKFNSFDARYHSGLLVFAVLVAFIIPETFSNEMTKQATQYLSMSISIVLICIYLAALYFKLVSHRGFYQGSNEKKKVPEQSKMKGEPDWGRGKSLLILSLSTILVAYVAEKLVYTFEVVGEELGVSELFIGVIIVAIVGNAAEHASAVIMAYKNRMDVTIEIAIGSSLQVSMFVAPVLVLLSFFIGEPMALVFSFPEFVSMAVAVLLIVVITTDGTSNWFEGLILLAAYIIIGIGFFLL